MFLFASPDSTPLVKNANAFRYGIQAAKNFFGRGAGATARATAQAAPTARAASTFGAGTVPQTAPTVLNRLHKTMTTPLTQLRVPGVNWKNTAKLGALGAAGATSYGMGYAGGAEHGATQALHQFMQGVEQQPWWERMKLGAGLATAPGLTMDAIVERMRGQEGMASKIGNQLYTWRRAAEGPTA
jgi:hypothetical protein